MKKAAQASITSGVSAKDLQDRLSKLGDWLEWEPETVWAELERSGIAIRAYEKDKINAVKALLTTNAFWVDHLAFEKIAVALNDMDVSFDHYQNPSPGMLAKAIAEANSIRQVEFSEEVLKYIATVAFEDGLVVLPPPLDVAQESLDELTHPLIGSHLKGEIENAWTSARSSGFPESVYSNTVMGIQVAKMHAIQTYAGASA